MRQIGQVNIQLSSTPPFHLFILCTCVRETERVEAEGGGTKNRRACGYRLPSQGRKSGIKFSASVWPLIIYNALVQVVYKQRICAQLCKQTNKHFVKSKACEQSTSRTSQHRV